jgi:NADPH:quinone reductase-like Zn-dependent oxidoreductase
VEQARALGADRVVDYSQEDFTKLDEQYDVLIDIAGSKPFGKLRRVLTPEATVVVVGAKFPGTGLIGPLGHVIRTRLAAIGKSQKVKFFIAKINKEDLAVMQELLDSGQVKSVIDRTYDLSQVGDALRYLGEGHARGKIVLTM